MKKVDLTIVIFLTILVCSLSSANLFAEQNPSGSAEGCSQARKDYMAAEYEWSSINAEVGFLRQELERLRDLRWETKGTLNLVEEALRILEEKGRLDRADLMTFNFRIPDGRGTINPDGTFILDGFETAPLREVKESLGRVLVRSKEDIGNIEQELKGEEEKSHRLNQRLAILEKTVEKECSADTPAPWAQLVPRTSGRDIYERYVERERQRQEEVDSRSWDDLERLWLRKYYYRYPYSPYRPGYRYHRYPHFDYYPYRPDYPYRPYPPSHPYSPY